MNTMANISPAIASTNTISIIVKPFRLSVLCFLLDGISEDKKIEVFSWNLIMNHKRHIEKYF